ncbi:hypothetical protein, partial [Nocardia cyriacigeorgica]|uniref:hypothetical protein n=1 Tax=Nocardia cyriacigeorgica TaxID=135487 RepID=UPI002456176F
MGTAIDPVLISRLSGEFETLGNQMWALGRIAKSKRRPCRKTLRCTSGSFGRGESFASASGCAPKTPWQ